MTDWTQVKPGTKVRGFGRPHRHGIFHGVTVSGKPIVEDLLNPTGTEVACWDSEWWEPIPTTYTLTLTGPTGDSESVEVERRVVESWTQSDSPILRGMSKVLLAREGEAQ